MASSISMAEVLRKLGKRHDGNTWKFVRDKIRGYRIDTSHFLGQRANSGLHWKGNKKPWQDVLVVKSDNRRQYAVVLRRALIESGVLYQCDCCGMGPIWNGHELRLHVDHIDGDFLNNTKNNLRFLCPNCHSQTTTFCNNKGMTTVVKCKKTKSKKCKCGKVIGSVASQCKSCSGYSQKTKITWPSATELRNMVQTSSYVAVAKRLGVSDNAVRKRLRNHVHVGE